LEEDDAPIPVQQSAAAGFRSFRTDPRPHRQGRRGRLSAVQHRADRRGPAAHHAGGLDDLEIQIEDNQLTIKGRQKDDPDRVYLYRGIAARQFQRSFVLAEGILVNSAMLDNGLLSVDLQRPKAVSQVRTVPISKAGGEKSSAKRVTVDADSK
jgi:hypothetical protein